jgi:hypothetical protein
VDKKLSNANSWRAGLEGIEKTVEFWASLGIPTSWTEAGVDPAILPVAANGHFVSVQWDHSSSLRKKMFYISFNQLISSPTRCNNKKENILGGTIL